MDRSRIRAGFDSAAIGLGRVVFENTIFDDQGAVTPGLVEKIDRAAVDGRTVAREFAANDGYVPVGGVFDCPAGVDVHSGIRPVVIEHAIAHRGGAANAAHQQRATAIIAALAILEGEVLEGEHDVVHVVAWQRRFQDANAGLSLIDDHVGGIAGKPLKCNVPIYGDGRQLAVK